MQFRQSLQSVNTIDDTIDEAKYGDIFPSVFISNILQELEEE